MQVHPNAQAKVGHFMATMDDYDRLEAAFPLPRTINWIGHRDDEHNRWVVVMHALMLRKYFQKDDGLQLHTVVEAAHKSVVKDDYPQSEWDAWVKDGEVFQTTTIYNLPDGKVFNESEMLRYYLYGRYLHGDYDKWMQTERTPTSASDGALWRATHDRAARVRELQEIVRAGVEAGAIVY